MLEQQYFVILRDVKKVLHILLLAAFLAVTAGCCDKPSQKQKRMVLLYLAATDGFIYSQVQGNIEELLTGYIPKKQSESEVLLIFRQDKDYKSSTGRGDATLTKYFINNSGSLVQEVIYNFGNEFNACDPDSFKQVLAAADAECQPTQRALLFSSHGGGWLPPENDYGTSSSIIPKSRSAIPSGMVEWIGTDAPTKDNLDIRDFADALGAYHWEAVLLDCCFMSSIEVAYQLKDCCDYIVASPTEILGLGFPYYNLTSHLFKNAGEKGLTSICREYYEKYKNNVFGSIALIKTSELDALSEICASIVALRRSEVDNVDASDVQKYGRDFDATDVHRYSNYFYDLAHYFEHFATAEQYQTLTAQMDKVVPYKASIETVYEIGPMSHYSGLSCYIPNPSFPLMNAYYKQLAWNQKVNIVQ